MTTATLVLAFFAIGAESASNTGTQAQARPIILDFTATWCGPCQAMKPVVEKLAEAGYPVRAVDIDRHPELAKRYKVHAVPTFVVVQPDGRELTRLSGATSGQELATLYRKSLRAVRETRAQPEPEPEPIREVAESEATAPGDEPRFKPWESVVRIKVVNHLSRPTTIEFGSGTVIYSTPEESIILTCAHIFNIEGARRQYPPRQFPLKMTVDLFDGQLSGGRTPQVHTLVEGIPAEVIDYDFPTDVGLIRIRPGKKLPYSPVVPPGWAPRESLKLTTVGCSEGRDATAWSTWVTRSLVRLGQHGGTYEATECAYPPIQGRSGGGLFTLDGMVAGVCDFNDGPVGKHGLYASPRSIHRLINRNRLQVAYAGSNVRRGPQAAQVASRDTGRSRSAVPGRGLPADKFRAQSPQSTERMIPIPPPSLLGAAIEDEEGATTSRVARRARVGSDSSLWKSAPSPEELATLERPERVQDERRRPVFDEIEPSAPRMSRMDVQGPEAEEDLFSNAPSFEDFESVRTPSRPEPGAEAGDPWKAAGRN